MAMNRRYLMLIALVAAGALAVGALARLPRAKRAGSEAIAPPPSSALSLVYEDGRLVPESARVPKGHLVKLTIANRGDVRVTVRLAGYEDRVSVASLAPGAEWRGEFTADRPGDGFAWLVDGQPAGRLDVTGSHLIEGHR